MRCNQKHGTVNATCSARTLRLLYSITERVFFFLNAEKLSEAAGQSASSKWITTVSFSSGGHKGQLTSYSTLLEMKMTDVKLLDWDHYSNHCKVVCCEKDLSTSLPLPITGTYRQGDRFTDRDRERQTCRQTNRKRKIKTDSYRERQGYKDSQ